MIKVLIVDDEELGRLRIRQLLEHETEFSIAGMCSGGQEALDWLESNECDLIFLDIQMPEVDGFEVIRLATPEKLPRIVFVTAYDQYAIDAFRVHALDYLQKPVDRELFKETLERVKLESEKSKQVVWSDKLEQLLKEPQQSFKDKFLTIKQGERIFPVQYQHIIAVTVKGNYLGLQVGDTEYRMRATLQQFLTDTRQIPLKQINRSVAINLEQIQEIQRYFKGEFAVIMKNGKEFITSAHYRKSIQELIE